LQKEPLDLVVSRERHVTARRWMRNTWFAGPSTTGRRIALGSRALVSGALVGGTETRLLRGRTLSDHTEHRCLAITKGTIFQLGKICTTRRLSPL